MHYYATISIFKNKKVLSFTPKCGVMIHPYLPIMAKWKSWTGLDWTLDWALDWTLDWTLD